MIKKSMTLKTDGILYNYYQKNVGGEKWQPPFVWRGGEAPWGRGSCSSIDWKRNVAAH